MVYVEDGCQFLHGNVQEHLLEVSSDGIILCHKEQNGRSYQSNCIGGHYKRIVEIKSIYDEANIAFRYQIPIYNACQLLCEMHVNKVGEAWYVVCSERTVILITLNYNVNIWNELWRIIKEKFDVQCYVRPKNIPVYKKELCNILHKYVREESEFIMEVPKVKGYIPDILHLCTEIKPYRSVYTARKQSCNYLQFIEDLNEVVHASEELLHDLCDLQRKTASQLLTFLLQIQTGNTIRNIPTTCQLPML